MMMRLPPGMRDRIAEAAHSNGRSMNAEVIARLEKTFEDDDYVVELEQQVEEHGEQLRELRSMIENLQHNMDQIIHYGGPSRDMR